MIIAFVLQGGYMVQSSPTSFFSFFFPDSLLYFLKVLVYILLQALRFSLIAENNYSHVLVVLFQKSSTTQYILLPSIFDMPGLYSISSLIRMTDKCGSTNFRLRGGGGGGKTECDRKWLSQLFGPQLTYSGFNVNFKENCTFWFQRRSRLGPESGAIFSIFTVWVQIWPPYTLCKWKQIIEKSFWTGPFYLP